MSFPPADAVAAPVQQSVRLRTHNRQTICAHDFGGTGDLVLIAHAAGFCGGAYAPLAAVLRNHFRVWAFDMRGHGDSAAPPDADFSWEGMAQDLLAVLENISLGPAMLFGHSLGGGVGLRAEALAPGSFSAMYVYEPAVLPDRADVSTVSSDMGGFTRHRRSRFSSRAEAVRRLASRPPFDTMCAEALESYAIHGLRETADSAFELKCLPEHEAMVYEASTKITVEQVADVSVPVMVAWGDRKEGLPAQAAPLIGAALPDAAVVAHRGLGHMGPFEDPSSVGLAATAHLGGRHNCW